MTPLHLRLWSAEAPDFVSENHQILEVIDTVRAATDGRGVYVIDRGGDRMELFGPFLDRKMLFIVRQVGDRHLLFRGARRAVRDLAHGCIMRYAERLVRETEEGEQVYMLEFGFRRVRLPGRDEDLPVKPSRASLWFVVRGYLGR